MLSFLSDVELILNIVNSAKAVNNMIIVDKTTNLIKFYH